MLMFWEVLRCMKFRPEFASALKLLTPESDRLEGPLNAKSPPFSFAEKPAFMVMVTRT
jgi:hypothetical protein